MPHDRFFGLFDRVRVINLADRTDRKREMQAQLARTGLEHPAVAFYEARRPRSAGGFPSVGARGCFDSHLTILQQAVRDGVNSLLIIEDDFDFTGDGIKRAKALTDELAAQEWDIFYGAHVLDHGGRNGIVQLSPDEPVLTASFVAFHGSVLPKLVTFLEGILRRPPGSPEYGPMHVDGAYTVFRHSHPECRTLAAFPSLGRQRSSTSDISPRRTFLDRLPLMKALTGLLRRGWNWVQRQ